MILYCYTDRDGQVHWQRSKVKALAAARDEAKWTHKPATIDVEQVTIKDIPTKELVVRILNRDLEFITEDMIEGVASIRARQPELEPEKVEPPEPPPPTPDEDEDDESEWVNVFGKRGYRPVRVNDLKVGMRLQPGSPKRPGVIVW